MKRFILTVLTTVLLMTAGLAAFLYSNGCIGVTKMDTEHTKQVYVDGELMEDKAWTEVLGYKVELHFNDSVTFTK